MGAGGTAGIDGVTVAAVQGVVTVATVVGVATGDDAAGGCVTAFGSTWSAGDRVSSRTRPAMPRTAPAATLATATVRPRDARRSRRPSPPSPASHPSRPSCPDRSPADAGFDPPLRDPVPGLDPSPLREPTPGFDPMPLREPWPTGSLYPTLARVPEIPAVTFTLDP